MKDEDIKSLSYVEARKLVQNKMAQVREILNDCEQLMDYHRFIADLPTEPSYHQVTYLPRNLTQTERQSIYNLDNDGNLCWSGIDERYKDGGMWISSSDYGDC